MMIAVNHVERCLAVAIAIRNICVERGSLGRIHSVDVHAMTCAMRRSVSARVVQYMGINNHLVDHDEFRTLGWRVSYSRGWFAVDKAA
jgi:hypothetical protein